MAARLLLMLALAGGVRTVVSCGGQSSNRRSYAQCYATLHDPYLDFGDATMYAYARSHLARQDCDIVNVWMLARHGSSYPDSADYKRLQKIEQFRKMILENYLKDKVSMCKADIDNLREKPLILPVEKAGQLMQAGKEELFNLGHMLGSIRELTDSIEQLKTFKFISTNTPRVRESAENFIKGMTKELAKDNKCQLPKPTFNQNIINNHATCRKWQMVTKKNEEENKMYLESKEMQRVMGSIALQLGLRLGDFDMDALLVIYDACRLQKAAVGAYMIAAWCAIFLRNELKVLEYNIDLQYYYKSGPGNTDLNRKLACPAVKSMIDTFRQAAANPKANQPSVFYFSDPIMLDILQVGLEMTTAADEPLAPDNLGKQQDRDYRTSKNIPAAGNIIVILYRCNGQERVQFFRNEKKFVHQECKSNNGFCEWKKIEKKFSQYVDSKSCLDMSWCNIV